MGFLRLNLTFAVVRVSVEDRGNNLVVSIEEVSLRKLPWFGRESDSGSLNTSLCW